jgi:hypothetical protein
MLIGGHQVIFEGCFKNTNESQMVSRFSNEVGHHFWLRGPFNHLGGDRYNTSSNFRVFVCLNHLLAEVGAFFIVFFSQVCSLCCYCCCCWIKIGLWIDDRVLKLKFTRNRGLIRFDKEKNLINQ